MLELLTCTAERPFVRSEQAIIFWSFIGLIVAGLALSGALWWLAQQRRRSPGSVAEIRGAARAFHERVCHFTMQVRTLDEHANEYTSIFSSEDWNVLVKTVSRLDEVDRQAQEQLRLRRYESVATLLGEFQGQGGSGLDDIQASLNSYYASQSWEQHVHGMLKRVVQNLEAATHETKEMSKTVTSRKRQPTLVTLADVKKTLLEDEVLRRHSNDASKM